jgi:hypothetical protein
MGNRISREDFPPLNLLVKHLRTLREDFGAVFDDEEIGEFAASYSDFWAAMRDKNSLEAAWFAYAQSFLPETPPPGGGREVLGTRSGGIGGAGIGGTRIGGTRIASRRMASHPELVEEKALKLVTGEHPCILSSLPEESRRRIAIDEPIPRKLVIDYR